MIHKNKEGEWLSIYSMNKRFRVRAICTTDEEANSFMERNQSTSVMAVFGPFIVICNQYEGEEPGTGEYDLMTALQEAKKLAEWKRDHIDPNSRQASALAAKTVEQLSKAIQIERERRLKSNGEDGATTQN